jgi:hypothetical protein
VICRASLSFFGQTSFLGAGEQGSVLFGSRSFVPHSNGSIVDGLSTKSEMCTLTALLQSRGKRVMDSHMPDGPHGTFEASSVYFMPSTLLWKRSLHQEGA